MKHRLTKDENEDVDYILDNINNPLYFENYCGACDYFNNETNCPFWGDVSESTEWKLIKCKSFND